MLGHGILAVLVAAGLSYSTATRAAGAPTETAYRTVFQVEVGASPTKTGASLALRKLQRAYPKLLGHLPAWIERTDLSSEGAWYQMHFGEFDGPLDAQQTCRALTLAGHQSCLVIKRFMPQSDNPKAPGIPLQGVERTCYCQSVGWPISNLV